MSTFLLPNNIATVTREVSQYTLLKIPQSETAFLIKDIDLSRTFAEDLISKYTTHCNQ